MEQKTLVPSALLHHVSELTREITCENLANHPEQKIVSAYLKDLTVE